MALKETIAKATAWALSLRLVRTWLHYSERRGPMLADSITYRTLFSLFAGVLLGFSFAALWLADNPVALEAIIDAVDAAIPGLIGTIVDVDDIDAPAGLTFAGIAALVGLVLAAIGAIGSLRNAMRTLSDSPFDDVMVVWVYVRNLALALAIGGGFVVAAAATFVGTAFVDTVSDWLGLAPGGFSAFLTNSVSTVAVFALDTGLIVLAFITLSGVRPPAGPLWSGAIIGGIGLTALQQLSGLFVGGASSNPLLVSFAALIALLLWINLSAQVILLASTWIILGTRERSDRVRERHGAPTMPLRRVRKAEDSVRVATDELNRAREAADLPGGKQ
ncbi:membrane protein [Microbacterium terrae]|uniref:Inner membrane protein YhjD n=1 Tax=Microbacterium terrae TaxID=69369 RepID=A0A0M2HAX9_9MICO|nr:YihY/virulence factor BrkB family protein [Microbacterium terrae]KJL41333.1 Inner membrane protein YhjD [Microbacterium terrae]MBP1077629.1 membrane protein [Microbacterium terrae]GLJ99234.1 hypothetical protein GCM10017594_24310 [Microbacterium terrae]